MLLISLNMTWMYFPWFKFQSVSHTDKRLHWTALVSNCCTYSTNHTTTLSCSILCLLIYKYGDLNNLTSAEKVHLRCSFSGVGPKSGGPSSKRAPGEVSGPQPTCEDPMSSLQTRGCSESQLSPVGEARANLKKPLCVQLSPHVGLLTDSLCLKLIYVLYFTVSISQTK